MKSRGVDVLLINPGGRVATYQSLAGELAAVEPPVWAGLIASILRHHALSPEIIDANAENLTPEQVAARVDAIAPKLAAVVAYGHQPSASTQSMPAVGAICSAIKRQTPDTPIVIVGGHAAALPERTLVEEDADFLCTGEGPIAVLELANAICAGRDPQEARGLCFKRNAQIERSAPAPLLQSLDAEMPQVAWDLLPMQRYRAHNWHCFGGLDRTPYAAIYTSLGCPYTCSFCCIQAPFKEGEQLAGRSARTNTYRMWSADSVLAQIDVLVHTHGVRNIKIADEMFVLNERHVNGICDGLIARDYGLNLWAYGRVDTITEARAETLKRAGFNWIALGIEAASEGVREGVQKAYAQEQIHRAVHTLRETGIHTIANYIFGLPDDDYDSMEATLDLALELNCEFANFYTAMAYPGSQLYRDATTNGWPLPKTWGGYSQHSRDTLPLPTKHIAAREVLQFRDAAFETYFSFPDYLRMIESTFGPATREEIQRMTAHKLERAIA